MLKISCFCNLSLTQLNIPCTEEYIDEVEGGRQIMLCGSITCVKMDYISSFQRWIGAVSTTKYTYLPAKSTNLLFRVDLANLPSNITLDMNYLISYGFKYPSFVPYSIIPYLVVMMATLMASFQSGARTQFLAAPLFLWQALTLKTASSRKIMQ